MSCGYGECRHPAPSEASRSGPGRSAAGVTAPVALRRLIRDDFRRAQRVPPSNALRRDAIAHGRRRRCVHTLAREEMRRLPRRHSPADAPLPRRDRRANSRRGSSYERLARETRTAERGRRAGSRLTRSMASLEREMRRRRPARRLGPHRRAGRRPDDVPVHSRCYAPAARQDVLDPPVRNQPDQRRGHEDRLGDPRRNQGRQRSPRYRAPATACPSSRARPLFSGSSPALARG